MSKTVKIPDNVSRVVVCINGVEYVYPGGATVTVPDDVAALLEDNAAEEPHGTRETGEVKNGGIIPSTYEETEPVYTDAEGNLMIGNKQQEAQAVHVTVSGDNVTTDISRPKLWIKVSKGVALLAILDNAVLPCVSASANTIVFQGSSVDATAGTLTVTIIELDKTNGNSKTVKVYDLTEHSEDAET